MKIENYHEHSNIKRKDLEQPSTLKSVFKDIRNFLAGMMVGMTRDESLSKEVLNLLFCKVYDEVNSLPDDDVLFQIKDGESPEMLKRRILTLFTEKVKGTYSEIFNEKDDINLDQKSLVYVVGKLQRFCITSSERDIITEAFEVFIGPTLRGNEGQFFTPRNVVKMIIDILDPKPGEYLIDPACGTGGFLITALEHVWSETREVEPNRKSPLDISIKTEKKEYSRFLVGIDKDAFLAKITKAYTTLLGGEVSVFCENSLTRQSEWGDSSRSGAPLGSFDVLFTNPPHGSRIQVKGNKTLEQYELARKWKSKNKLWVKTDVLRESQPPQILFIERCLDLLKIGGRMGIIIPESLLGNPTYGYVPTYIQRMSKILGIVSMPEELFQPYTHNKVCVLFLEKSTREVGDYPIFMSALKWCGHNSRGDSIPYDDVPKVAPRFHRFRKVKDAPYESLSFSKKFSQIKSNILLPKYYNPNVDIELKKLEDSHDLVLFGQLVEDGVVDLSTGVEIGRLSYGTGPVPFIRTSDISNWEIKIDPKHCVSEKIYAKYKDKFGVEENDILMVRDGTYLIGTSCMITQYDTKILFQSHIYRLRVVKKDAFSPFLLFATLNSPVVKKQIRSKQFTQNIIDTIGKRIVEIALPIPKDPAIKERIASETREIVETRAKMRHRATLIHR